MRINCNEPAPLSEYLKYFRCAVPPEEVKLSALKGGACREANRSLGAGKILNPAHSSGK